MTKSELQIFAEQTFPLSFAHNPKVDVEELINQVAAAAIAWNAWIQSDPFKVPPVKVTVKETKPAEAKVAKALCEGEEGGQGVKLEKKSPWRALFCFVGGLGTRLMDGPPLYPPTSLGRSHFIKCNSFVDGKPLVKTWQIDCTSLRGYALICVLLANTLTAC
jgi:hypothetical protein